MIKPQLARISNRSEGELGSFRLWPDDLIVGHQRID